MLLAFDNDSIPFRHGLQLELIAAQGDGGNPVVPLGGPRAADTGLGPSGNRAERLEWYQTLGLGLFIHWSVDSQLGIVIRHRWGAHPQMMPTALSLHETLTQRIQAASMGQGCEIGWQ